MRGNAPEILVAEALDLKTGDIDLQAFRSNNILVVMSEKMRQMIH